MLGFRVNRGAVSERGVPTVRIVPALDVTEEGKPGFGVRGESVLREASVEKKMSAIALSYASPP